MLANEKQVRSQVRRRQARRWIFCLCLKRLLVIISYEFHNCFVFLNVTYLFILFQWVSPSSANSGGPLYCCTGSTIMRLCLLKFPRSEMKNDNAGFWLYKRVKINFFLSPLMLRYAACRCTLMTLNCVKTGKPDGTDGRRRSHRKQFAASEMERNESERVCLFFFFWSPREGTCLTSTRQVTRHGSVSTLSTNGSCSWCKTAGTSLSVVREVTTAHDAFAALKKKKKKREKKSGSWSMSYESKFRGSRPPVRSRPCSTFPPPSSPSHACLLDLSPAYLFFLQCMN